MLIRFKTTLRNSMAAQIVAALDGGGGPARLSFYTGAIPASGDASITTQTLLGTLVCSSPSASVAAGVVTFYAISDDAAADGTGTAAFAALYAYDGTLACYLDVTNEAGNGAIKLENTAITAGGRIVMLGLSITVGA